jgi:asparagine synthase (glutamine-hydrolysing)
MSGFAGLLPPRGAPVDAAVLRGMADALASRGPDGGETWSDARIGLAHAALRTTDDTRDAPQPLSLDGRVWIAADARVDGRGELLRALRSAGRPAAGDAPDAELILHAYHAWGDGCVERLIGDFAFALWDAPRGRLLCARDHFGVVPFYYARTAAGLVFGNTLQAVRAHPAVSDALDRRTLGDYLLFGFSADHARGFYADVQRLPPAHTLVAEGGEVRVRRWWTPPEPDEDAPPIDDAERIERFRALLGEAVADRMRCGRVDVAMSGGLDSPAVAAMAARHAGAGTRVEGWSIGFDWLLPDTERHWAGLAAGEIGIRFHPLSGEPWFLSPPGGDPWRRVPEPRFETRHTPGTQLPPRVAAEGGRVILSGMGGDVLVDAPRSRWMEMLSAGRMARFAVDAWAYRRRFGRRPPLRASWRSRRMRGRPAPVLAPLDLDFAREMGLQARADEVQAAHASVDPRHGMALHAFWAEVLSAMDPESTGVPVRFRHPFFDVRLLAETLRTPPVPWLVRKTLLREACAGVLPPAILRRPKAPVMGNPYWQAATGGHEPWLASLPDAPELEGFVDRARLRRMVDSVQQDGPARYTGQVLIPASLAAWLRMRGGPSAACRAAPLADAVVPSVA